MDYRARHGLPVRPLFRSPSNEIANGATGLKVKYGDEFEEGALLSKLMAYCSKEAHSCVEKAAMIGFVKLRILEPDQNCSLRGHTLRQGFLYVWIANIKILKNFHHFSILATEKFPSLSFLETEIFSSLLLPKDRKTFFSYIHPSVLN